MNGFTLRESDGLYPITDNICIRWLDGCLFTVEYIYKQSDVYNVKVSGMGASATFEDVYMEDLTGVANAGIHRIIIGNTL